MKKTIFSAALLLFSTGVFAQYAIIENWSNSHGSTGNDQSRCVVSDASGNTYYTGYFNGTVDFDPGTGTANLVSSGSGDIYLAKYDVNGDYVWAEKMGGTGDDAGLSLVLDGSGNIYVTGTFRNTVDFDPGTGTANLSSSGFEDIFVAKYDNSGNYSWAFKIGSSYSDNGLDISIDGNDDIYICGNIYGNADFDPGAGTKTLGPNTNGTIVYPAGYVAKYNSSGAMQWAFTLSGNASTNCTSVINDNSNYVYVTGSFAGTTDFNPGFFTANKTSAGGADAYLARYTSGGVYSWVREFGGTSAETGTALACDGTDYVYVAGNFAGTADLLGGTGTINYTAVGGDDVFLSRYELTGACYWIKQIGGSGDEYCKSVDFYDGEVGITGSFTGTCDFDPSGSVFNLYSNGAEDIFMAFYNGGTSYLELAANFGGEESDIGYGIEMADYGIVWLAGKFGGSNVNFGSSNHTSAGADDIIHAEYTWGDVDGMRKAATVTQEEKGQSPESKLSVNSSLVVAVYPNPSSGMLTIENAAENSSAEIYSVNGEKVRTLYFAGSGKQQVDLSGLENGVYMLFLVQADGSVRNEKIVLQR